MDNSVERGYEIAPGVAENDDEARAIAEMDAYLREKYPNIEYEVKRYSPGDGWASPSSTMHAVTPQGEWFRVKRSSDGATSDSYVGALLQADYTAIMCEAIESVWPDSAYAVYCDISLLFPSELREDVTLQDVDEFFVTNKSFITLYVECPAGDFEAEVRAVSEEWRRLTGWSASITVFSLELGTLSEELGVSGPLVDALSVPGEMVVERKHVTVN